MQVDIRDDGSIVFIEPVGDIDGKTAPEVHDKVFKLLLPQARIVLNLERVAFMSSAGLREMLLIYRVNDDIRSSMSATGFVAFFVLGDSVEDAISRMG
jgi:anti-sigma B factor antagonist